MLWRISQFPELDCLEAEQRKTALRHVSWGAQFALIGRAWLAGWFLAVPMFLVIAELAPGVGHHAWLVGVALLTTLVTGAVCYQLLLRRVRYSLRRELAAAYAGAPAPFCFVCGYDLRGHVGSVCPECGRRDNAVNRPASLARMVGRSVGRWFQS